MAGRGLATGRPRCSSPDCSPTVRFRLGRLAASGAAPGLAGGWSPRAFDLDAGGPRRDRPRRFRGGLAARAAGRRSGEVIVRFAGRPIGDSADRRFAVADTRPGRTRRCRVPPRREAAHRGVGAGRAPFRGCGSRPLRGRGGGLPLRARRRDADRGALRSASGRTSRESWRERRGGRNPAGSGRRDRGGRPVGGEYRGSAQSALRDPGRGDLSGPDARSAGPGEWARGFVIAAAPD